MSLIDKLSKEQIADFREAFSLFDHDENGSISASELGQVLKALGQNPSRNELYSTGNAIATANSTPIADPSSRHTSATNTNRTNLNMGLLKMIGVFDGLVRAM